MAWMFMVSYVETLRRIPLVEGVLLEDVAGVDLRSPRLPYGRHLDRRFAVGIDVYKEPTANTVATVARLRQRMKELERENRELRRANEILKKASAYFAQAELDRRPK